VLLGVGGGGEGLFYLFLIYALHDTKYVAKPTDQVLSVYSNDFG